MKKYYFLIIVALILGLVLTGCSLLSNISQVPTTNQSGITYLTKHTEGDPFATDLIAGGGNSASATDVGDVLVWNDGDTLYVQYVVTAPWCLTETHLHVAISLEGIPQKNGNPPPGKFDYKGEHDCVAEYLYTIPLNWSTDTKLFIAAHAVVVNTETIETEINLEWGRSREDKDSIRSSLNLGGAVMDGLGLDIDKSQEVWDKNTWAYWAQYHLDNVSTYRFQVRHFQALLDLPKEIKPDNVENLILFNPDYLVDDIIPINDNIYVYLNNIEIGRKGTCYPPAFLDWGVSPDVGWYVPGSFSAEGPKNLDAGLNIIDIVAEESCGWGGMGELGLKLIWHPEETAWGAGLGFPGANWATYFTYTVQQLPEYGLVLWLDAGKGITEASGVSMWEDQSGNGNHAEQGTESFQPTYVEYGLNDKPFVSFPGGEKYLRHPSILTDDYTAFYVLKLTESKINKVYYYHAGSVNTGDLGFFAETKNKEEGWGSAGNVDTSVTVRTSELYPTPLDWRIHTHQPEALYKDGVEVSYGREQDVYAGGLTDIGSRSDHATLYFVGDIAEILVYDRILTDSEREMVEDYLSDKYGI
jgi:hypothetical protein